MRLRCILRMHAGNEEHGVSSYEELTNVRELGNFSLGERRFVDEGHIIRRVESGVKLVALQELLQGLRVTGGTLGTHVVEERPQGGR